MAVTRAGNRVVYRSRARSAHAVLRATYEPTGPPVYPVPGTLEYFLTERYCLYTVDERRRVAERFVQARPEGFAIAVHAGAQSTEELLRMALRGLGSSR
jgi:uncharacterized protein YqjF (DUF2071 family)